MNCVKGFAVSYDPILLAKDVAGLCQKYKITNSKIYKPPKSLEPELKYKLPSIEYFPEVIGVLEEAEKKGDLIILDLMQPRKRFLISVSMDTVDKNGYPTFQVENSGHLLRSRFDFDPREQIISKIDISAKERLEYLRHLFNLKAMDANNPDMKNLLHVKRREWELETELLPILGGYQEFLVANHGNELPYEFDQISSHFLRAETVIATARGTYFTAIKIPGVHAIALFEHAHDVCAIAPPYFDTIIGHRYELEPEVKYIITEENVDEKHLIEIIDTAMTKMDNIIRTSALPIIPSQESKIEEAQYLVNQHFKNSAKTAGVTSRQGREGRRYALIQNVDPDNVIKNRKGLKFLTQTLPDPRLLLQGHPHYTFMPSY
jgi:hypothetical protein